MTNTKPPAGKRAFIGPVERQRRRRHRELEQHKTPTPDATFTHVGREPVAHREIRALPSGSQLSGRLTEIDDVDDLLREWGVEK
jgi:hypothetical protein